MTVEDLEKAAADFRFVGSLALWRPTVIVRRDAGVSVLLYTFVVPDSGGSGKMADVGYGVELTEHALDWWKDPPEQFIAHHLVGLVLHEMYESITVRGERVFDPHDMAKYHPGSI